VRWYAQIPTVRTWRSGRWGEGGGERGCPLIVFAIHIADLKGLAEDEETGEQSRRYIRIAADHYSLAFTYDCIAALRDPGPAYIPPRSSEPFWDPILHAQW